MFIGLRLRLPLCRLGLEAGYKPRARRTRRRICSGQDFDLMLSDVVMPPGMSGVELVREARRLRRGIKVLLTSGYAENVLRRHGATDEFPIIDKPFRLADLAQRLRSLLHET